MRPRAKDHVAGTYQVAFFLRDGEGNTVEYASTAPLARDSAIVKLVGQLVAAALNIETAGPGAGKAGG